MEAYTAPKAPPTTQRRVCDELLPNFRSQKTIQLKKTTILPKNVIMLVYRRLGLKTDEEMTQWDSKPSLFVLINNRNSHRAVRLLRRKNMGENTEKTKIFLLKIQVISTLI